MRESLLTAFRVLLPMFLSAEAVRDISEMGYAYLCICQQMYDVRDMTVSKDSLNPIVQQIIYAHAVNYL